MPCELMKWIGGENAAQWFSSHDQLRLPLVLFGKMLRDSEKL